MPAEFDFIAWIRSRQTRSDLVRLGSGDDLAVLNWPAGELLVAGVDQVLDTVHFDSRIHGPRDIGRKAMNRNLSDCAAMACLPAAALATVALPIGVGMEYAKELYLGMEGAANKFNCAIIGGDTGAWKFPLAVTVTILGRSAGIAPVTRSGAKAGDSIYVSGALGGSIHGRHMSFEPRVQMARELAGKFRINGMIDISDGLARDLHHICRESGVGAILDKQTIPVHADAKMELQRALHDGEDYELLLTSPDEIPNLTRIGKITAERTVFLRDGVSVVPLKEAGWEHTL
jgi:thiamine-monophosphate kinase